MIKGFDLNNIKLHQKQRFKIKLHTKEYLVEKYGTTNDNYALNTRLILGPQAWKDLSSQAFVKAKIIVWNGEARFTFRDVEYGWYFCEDVVKDIEFSGDGMSVLSHI
jgi:hypothetical protein